MARGFDHPSRPQVGGPGLEPALLTFVGHLAAAYFPGSSDYPDGLTAQVPAFIAARATDDDRHALARLAERYPATSAADAAGVLATLEAEDPELFGYLAVLLCHGYYAGRRVLATMSDRGYTYHGAPQPLGYPSSGELRLPSASRGSYIRTEEVSRADIR